MHQNTISAYAVKYLSEFAANLGIDYRPILAELKISEEFSESDHSRIDRDTLQKLWGALVEKTNNPLIGVEVGLSVDPSDLGPLGYAMKYSNTVGEAVDKLVEHSVVLGHDIIITKETLGNVVEIEMGAPVYLRPTPWVVHCWISILMTVIHQVAGRTVKPLSVALPSHPDICIDTLSTMWHTPVCSDESRFVMSYCKSDMDLHLAQAEAKLASALTAHTEALHEKVAQQLDLVDRIEESFGRLIASGQLGIGTVAEDLGMPERKLQRLLQSEGHTFSALLTDYRQKQAEDLLKSTSYAVAEISNLLGYSNVSSFTRAFSKWHDESPMGYREMH